MQRAAWQGCIRLEDSTGMECSVVEVLGHTEITDHPQNNQQA